MIVGARDHGGTYGSKAHATYVIDVRMPSWALPRIMEAIEPIHGRAKGRITMNMNMNAPLKEMPRMPPWLRAIGSDDEN